MEDTKDVIRGRFTRYIETALSRAKRDFLQKKAKIASMEEIMELNWLYLESEKENIKWQTSYMEAALNVLWEPKAVRSFLEEQIEKWMQETLLRLNDEELLIVFAKVFWQLTFAEIADRLGKDEKRISYVYSYARIKLKKGLDKNGI